MVVHIFSKSGFLMLARLVTALERAGGEAVERLRGVIWDSSPGSVVNYDEFIAGTWASAMLMAKKAGFDFSKTARTCMDGLLRGVAYPEQVRESYSSIHSLMPSFPLPGRHHLFIYSKRDLVCNASDISAYATACTATAASCVSVEVNMSNHCDALFWDPQKYGAAVRQLLDTVLLV